MAITLLLMMAAFCCLGSEKVLPAFGRDTVLVWQTQNQNFESTFVARIATFFPDRFLEWESREIQGTVFMKSEDIEKAGGFVNNRLFNGGVDTKSRKVTTLWLSRRLFQKLKSKGKAKCQLDGVGSEFKYQGQDQLEVEVNGKMRMLPVIKVSDGRGAEYWFLDREDNPLMAKHALRSYSRTLTVISTDRPNTLRWIKGKKLTNPSH
jgi:hypothetical protein